MNLRILSVLLFAVACVLIYISSDAAPLAWMALLLALTSGLVLRSKSRAIESLSTSVLQPSDDRSSQSERILNAAMSGMREGVIVIDERMRVIALNGAGSSIFPRHDGPPESKRLSELTRNKAIHAAFTDVLERGEYSEAKVELLGSERRVFDLRVVPLRQPDDTSTHGAMGVFFDITQIDQLERVRQEFLSNVSHELRTPLTAILAFVETLEEGALEDQQNNRRFLGVIRRNAERMRNLIDDILDLSAIEAGNVHIESAAIPLRELVDDISTALSSRAADRAVSIRNDVDPEVDVFADHHRLEQMLTNLIDNALKFNHPGGTVRVQYQSGQMDRITVMDEGEGIAPEHLARIFERFYRVDRARSREMGGTGLGLAIVKHLARLHGGEVSVQSSLGQGSTFIIDLPRPPAGSALLSTGALTSTHKG